MGRELLQEELVEVEGVARNRLGLMSNASLKIENFKLLPKGENEPVLQSHPIPFHPIYSVCAPTFNLIHFQLDHRCIIHQPASSYTY
jgi:hypothetical protein